MINAVGRDIPDELLVNGKEVYQGKNYMDGKYLHKAAPTIRRYEKPQESKILASITEALKACGAKDGMTFSFHHHLRDGDYVVNMVMKAAIEELGLKDLTIAATSLGSAHDPIADYIEEGKVIGIQTSGIRGRMGEVVSAGKLKTPAIIRSHGGRPRAIEAGEVHIDIAFVAAPTSDCVGNCRGIGGKSNCGSMGYAMTDAKYADHVVVVTDCLVDFPNMPASVEAIDVDAVVVVDSIGNPKKIASYDRVQQTVILLLFWLFNVQKRTQHLSNQHIQRKQSGAAANHDLPDTTLINSKAAHAQDYQPHSTFPGQGAE